MTLIEEMVLMLEECKNNLCYNHSGGINTTDCPGRTCSCTVTDNIDNLLTRYQAQKDNRIEVWRDRLESKIKEILYLYNHEGPLIAEWKTAAKEKHYNDPEFNAKVNHMLAYLTEAEGE